MANHGTYNFTKQHFAEGAAAATPDSGEVVVYAKSDGHMYQKDDAGTEADLTEGSVAALDDVGDVDAAAPSDGDVLTWNDYLSAWTAEAPAAGGGDVATDAIWDAAGDLAVGSGANTAAKLAIGAAGGALSVINSAVAWNSGTSFPGSAATGDRYWRTDLRMEFFYDGTRWLSSTIFEIQVESVTGITSTRSAVDRRLPPPLRGGSDIWLEDAVTGFNIGAGGSALSASHKWVITLVSVAVTTGANTTFATINIDSGASEVWREATTTIDALMGSGTAQILWFITETKTGTPGAFNAYTSLTYRIVAA